MLLPIPQYAYLRSDHFEAYKKEYINAYNNKYLPTEFMNKGIRNPIITDLLMMYYKAKNLHKGIGALQYNINKSKFTLADREDELKLVEKFLDDLDEAAKLEYESAEIEEYSLIVEVIRKFNPEAARRLEIAKDKTYAYSDIRRRYNNDITYLENMIKEKNEIILNSGVKLSFAIDFMSKMCWAFATNFRNIYEPDNS